MWSEAGRKTPENPPCPVPVFVWKSCHSTRKALSDAVAFWQKESFVPKDIQAQLPAMKLILALTEKYSALVMNPPYMGNNNMNLTLSRYVKENYDAGKQDLCTSFMLMQSDRTGDNGYYANIIPPSWMFLSTFESLRLHIIKHEHIDSLLHLSRGVFGADFGSVSCVIQKTHDRNCSGTYFRLIERTFQEFDQKHLQLLFEKTLANHDFRYDFSEYSKEIDDICYSNIGAQIYYPKVSQKNFEQIPGCPLGYWVSDNFISNFQNNNSFTKYGNAKAGLSTTDNNRFLRFWHEISINDIGFTYSSLQETEDKLYRYVPHTKGGQYRKWYGNIDYVVNWYNNGQDIRKAAEGASGGRIVGSEYYFKEGITWSDISSGNIAVRQLDRGFIYNSSSPSAFFKDNNFKNYIMAVLNSNVAMYYLKLLAPTIHYNAGPIEKVPVVYNSLAFTVINEIISNCCNTSKADWDSHETSWDFQENELIKLQKEGLGTITAGLGETTVMKYSTLSLLYSEYIAKWEKMFRDLHANEEELNRQFIEIYGLQDELTPEVPLDEVTILQQGEIKIENNQIQFQRDVVFKQLISYAVGCWMGRYRLDKPGLHIAHPSPTTDEICTYSYGNETLTIDDDGNIPLLPYDCPFDDNLQNRIADFVRIAFGADSLAENLNFIEQSLGCTIEKYLDKDFWKDHKKMYSNRPIYWLWSSKKGAFRVLSYMHRMDAYTAERIRSKYLLPYIEFLQNKINELSNRGAGLSTADSRKLDNYRKILEECQEYHERLQVVAEQAIGFDLDDGVVVNYAKFGDVLSKIK